MHARVLVLYHRELIDLSELFEDGFQVLFLQVPRDLTDEQLYRVGLLH